MVAVFRDTGQLSTAIGRKAIDFANANPLPMHGPDEHAFNLEKLKLHQEGLNSLIPDCLTILYHRAQRSISLAALRSMGEAVAALKEQHLQPLLDKPSDICPRVEGRNSRAIANLRAMNADELSATIDLAQDFIAEISRESQFFMRGEHSGCHNRDWTHYYVKSLVAVRCLLAAYVREACFVREESKPTAAEVPTEYRSLAIQR